MDVIHQLYCTHCTHGTSAFERETGTLADQVLGYSVRASSLVGDELRKCYRRIEPWLYYYLPRGSPTNAKLYHTAASAPKRLIHIPFADSLEILAQICYRQKDAAGRPGSYFAHVLVRERSDQQPPWSPTDCLRLWGARGWTEEDTAGLGFDLKSLASLGELLDDQCPVIDEGLVLSFLTTPISGLFNDPRRVIPERWRRWSPEQRQQVFLNALSALVSVQRRQYASLLLAVEPGMAALLFFGMLRLVPRGFFSQDVGFSTFEPHPERARATLAATCVHDPDTTELPFESLAPSVCAVNTYLKEVLQGQPAIPQFVRAFMDRLLRGGWRAVERAAKRTGASATDARTDKASLSIADSSGSQASSPATVQPAAATSPAQEVPPRAASVSEEFDPYHKWLGISPADQPPHHYRLLGIDLLECDLDVIAHAADQRMAYVRNYQTGPHSALSQQILNQIAAARVCLLNPAKKAAYDAELRHMLAAGNPQSQATTSEPELRLAADTEFCSAPSPLEATSPPARATANKGFRREVWIIANMTSAILVLVGLLLWRLSSTGLPSRDTVAVDDQRATVSTPASKPPEVPLRAPDRSKGKHRAPEGRPERSTAMVGDEIAEDAMESTIALAPGVSRMPLPSLEPPSSPLKPSSVSSRTPPPGDGTQAAMSGRRTAPAPVAAQPGARLSERHVDAAGQPSKADSSPRSDLPGRSGRQPVPPESAFQEAMEAVKERFRHEYKSAKTATDRKALAKILLTEARKAKTPDAQKYALLTMASDAAIKAGDLATALEAADDLATGYDVDGLDRKTSLLATYAKQSHPATEHRSIAEHGRKLAGQALAQGNSAIAIQAAELMLAAARRSRDTTLAKAAVTAQAKVTELATVCNVANAARGTLKQNPDNPQANLAVGLYLCGVQRDWDQGLLHLSQGSDQGLKSLAQQEITTPPSDTEGERQQADAWWDRAEASHGLVQDVAYARAGHWYKKAQSKIESGLVRNKIDKRLDDIQELRPPGDLPALASSASNGTHQGGGGIAGSPPAKTIPETIDTELRLPRSGGPYKLTGRVTVGPEGKLLLERGALVLASPGSALVARGTISSYGDSQDFVRFRPVAPQDGWQGIVLPENAKQSLERWDIRGAACGLETDRAESVELRDCSLVENKIGLKLHVGGSPTGKIEHWFRNCLIADNQTDGILLTGHRIGMEHCTISGNRGVGINLSYYGHPEIKYCTISGNGIGLQTRLYETYLDMASCNIVGNQTASIRVNTQQDLQCRGNYWGTTDPQQITLSLDDGRRRGGNGVVVFADFARKAISDAGCSLRVPKERRGASSRRAEGGKGAR